MIQIDKRKLYTNNGYTFKNYVMLSEVECRDIWSWRNGDNIRCWMLHSEIIPLENHLKFVDSLKHSTDCFYWMTFHDEKPIGVVYLRDVENNTGDFGYYVKPGCKGVGFGLVKEGLNFVLNVLGLDKIVLSVDVTNKVAIALDLFLGFEFDREETVDGRTYKWCDNYNKEIIDSKYNLAKEEYFKYMHSLSDEGYFK